MLIIPDPAPVMNAVPCVGAIILFVCPNLERVDLDMIKTCFRNHQIVWLYSISRQYLYQKLETND